MIRRILIALVLIAAAVFAFVTLDPLDLLGEEGDGTLTLYGNVDIREVALSFRVGGRLAEVLLDEGDTVAQGQALALLDDQPYREELAVARAQVARARAQLDRLEAGFRPQEVRQARARVAEAEASLENARRELERKAGLVDSGGTSRRELEQAEARHQESAARLAAAREALALAEEGFRPEEIESGRAELAIAEARLEQAETAVADTRLVAPSPGVILTRVQEPGSMVSAGSPVYALSLSDPVYLRAYVSEPDLGHAVPGREVTFRTDSSERVYRGQIGFVSPRAEFTPKSVETPDLRTDLVYRLRIVVEDPDDALRQGMPVTVTLADADGQGA